MKISYINKNYSNNINVSEKTEKKPLENNTEGSFSPSFDPKYYQVINNVHFGSLKKEDDAIVYIPNTKGDIFVFFDLKIGDVTKSIPVQFEKKDVDKFLLNEDKQISSKKLQAFTKVFQSELEKEISENKRRYDECTENSKGIEDLEEKYGEIAENFNLEDLDDDSIDYINEQLKQKSKEENNAISEAFANIENEDMFMDTASKLFSKELEKKRFMSFMADFYKNLDFKYYKEEALNTTRNILSLSKNENGYDLSDLEEKKRISDEIKYIIWDTGDSNIEKAKLSNFLENLFLKNKNVDINYVKDVLTVLKASGMAVLEVQKTDKLLDECYKKDSEHKKEILDSIVFFAKNLNMNDSIFYAFVSKIFNPKTEKYSNQRTERLIDFWKKFDEWMDKRFETEGSFDNDLVYLDAQKEVTLKYIDKITDDTTGEIKQDAISPEEFIKKTEKDYM